MADPTVPEQSALRALDHLEDRMRRVGAEANSFATKFHFGGMVAIIALLNTYLLIDAPIVRAGAGWQSPVTWIVAVLILGAVWQLSKVYFDTVAAHLSRFEKAYRKTKHKYELLLYGLWLGEDLPGLLLRLETAPEPAPEALPFPEPPDYPGVAAYLHDHHGRLLRQGPVSPAEAVNTRIPLLVVRLAIVIKAALYVLLILNPIPAVP